MAGASICVRPGQQVLTWTAESTLRCKLVQPLGALGHPSAKGRHPSSCCGTKAGQQQCSAVGSNTASQYPSRFPELSKHQLESHGGHITCATTQNWYIIAGTKPAAQLHGTIGNVSKRCNCLIAVFACQPCRRKVRCQPLCGRCSQLSGGQAPGTETGTANKNRASACIAHGLDRPATGARQARSTARAHLATCSGYDRPATGHARPATLATAQRAQHLLHKQCLLSTGGYSPLAP